MGLTMREKQAVTKQLALSYRRAGKEKRGEILDWLVELTGYNRSYAARVLRQRAKPKVLGRLRDGGVEITLVEDERTKRRKRRRSRPRKYDKEVLEVLEKIWVICDCICGKRLAPYLPEIIPVLERWGELEIGEEVRAKLLEISSATIDTLGPGEKAIPGKGKVQDQTGDSVEGSDPDPHLQRMGRRATRICGG